MFLMFIKVPSSNEGHSACHSVNFFCGVAMDACKISKIKVLLALKDIFSETTYMCKCHVSNIILTTLRKRG